MNKLFITTLLYLCFTGHTLASLALPSEQQLEKVGRLFIDDLLARESLMWYASDVFNGFHYAEAVTVYGALQVAEQLNDDVRLNALHTKYNEIPDFNTLAGYHHVDGSVIGIVPLQIYRVTGDATLKHQGLVLADAQWDNPLPTGLTSQSRFWIDDIYMINAIQVQAFRVTQDTQYLDKAALNTVAYLQKIQRENGLFWHGPEAPHFWGRGNGWVAAGIAELLTELPPQHPNYKAITQSYLRMVKTLTDTQAPSGMWRQLLTNPDSWEESSATAMFAWAILVGIQQNILDQKTYLPVVNQAWQALISQINEQGKLSNICVGTGQSKQQEYYLERPRVDGDLHGHAPMLWLISDLMDYLAKK
ncbi:glycoside hydrolase family 88/105 protein [Glaciecola sp. 1036]|uniref:glycoside hydrolase family 88/105 protein n=1 Tax=Alteromonadaceae TaxID=72275 RepID=UPI003CFDC12C